MSLTPGYGETPVPDDELDALLPDARELVGEPVTKSVIYDLEQALQNETAERALTSVLDGTLTVADLLSDSFLRELHSQLYGEIWAWAGRYRKRELNIGVPPEHVAVELRGSSRQSATGGSIRPTGRHASSALSFTRRSGGFTPFADGNGRSSRLLADSCSSPRRTPIPLIYTTGTSTSSVTSICFVSTIATAIPESLPSS